MRVPYWAHLLILAVIFVRPAVAWEDEDFWNRSEKEDWQKAWDLKKAREAREMEDFVGAVYRGGGNFVLVGDGMAVGSGGAIIRAGDTFLTPRGAYVKAGTSYLRPDGGAVVEAGDSFVSWDGTMVRAGNVYVGAMGASVVAGDTVLRNFREKPGWSTR